MKTEEIILYDSYYSAEKEAEARRTLFEEYADEEEWTSPEDIPDYRIFREIELEDDIFWEAVKSDLEILFKNDHFLLTGYCGTWHGNMDGGKFINSLSELLNVFQHLDDLRITDLNGHLIIEGAITTEQTGTSLNGLPVKVMNLQTLITSLTTENCITRL